MKNNSSFYNSKTGYDLVFNQQHPAEISDFLAREELCLRSLMVASSCFIEIGCMWGRYAGIATDIGVKYVGVDVVDSYIKEARDKYEDHTFALSPRFLLEDLSCDISPLVNILADLTGKEGGNPLVVFPFNSLGNITRAEDYLSQIVELGIPVVVISYKYGCQEIGILKKYYESSLKSEIEVIDLLDRVEYREVTKTECFVSTTYKDRWFQGFSSRVSSFELSDLGIIFVINSTAEILNTVSVSSKN